MPATVAVVTPLPASATVGTAAGDAAVKVADATGEGIRGITVTFVVSRGGGVLSAATLKTDSLGVAKTSYRLGTMAGLNEVTAFVPGFAGVQFQIAGTPAAAKSIIFGQRLLRYTVALDSLNATVVARDTFANNITSAVTWSARDTTLIAVSPTAFGAGVKLKKRPGTTFLVASSGAAIDSLPVYVLDADSSPCAFQAAPTDLAVGGALTFDAGVACIKASDAGAEYAVVAHVGTTAFGVSQSLDVLGEGISAPPLTFPDPAPPSLVKSPVTPLAFERRLRATEAREIGPRVAAARSAMRSAAIARAPAASSLAKEGDALDFNVNAIDFCTNVDTRRGRVVAVTSTAVIIADIDNPAGGFTDEEYRQFGTQVDTLVTPLITQTFGAPSDVDGNNRIQVFFTRAVNELTPTGSAGGVVLGYYYMRDLLPKHSVFGDCPGSNASEMFYVMVPDAAGAINENPRSKAFVSSAVVSIIAHEFQHLVNASRRMYVNDAIRVNEEVWLNEGLSHIAEELLFYRASGLSPRSNIGAAQLAPGSKALAAFDNYQRSNFGRYQQYLKGTEGTSPVANDDQLETRGAAWAFLRYLADRTRPADGDFWYKLTNSRRTGVVNLDSVLAGTGVTTIAALRDWTTAVIADDNPPGAAPNSQQPSWNYISAFGAVGGGLAFDLKPRVLQNGIATGVGIIGGGVAFLRFAVAQNKEAFIRVNTVGGAAVPVGVRLTVVRIK